MKIYSLINLVLFVVAWGMGYVLWDWKDQLAEEFFRVGWENYDGKSLDAPSNIFAVLFLLINGTVIVWMRVLEKKAPEMKEVGFFIKIWAIIGVVFSIIMLLQDGGLSIKESRWVWQIICAGHILLSFFLWLQLRKKTLIARNNNILDDFTTLE